jgi:hypothetical protein
MRTLMVVLGGGVLMFYFLRDLSHGALSLSNTLPLLILILALIFYKPINAKLAAWTVALNKKADELDADSPTGNNRDQEP